MTTFTTLFYQFPLLPKELQLAIWNIALQEPRVVTVRKKDRHFIAWPHIPDRATTLYYFSPTPPPALTQVCFESRTAAKSTYTLAFTDGLIPHYTFINFKVDRIIISDRDLFAAAQEDKLAIRYLVMTTYEWSYINELLLWGHSEILCIPVLKELTIVGNEEWKKDEGSRELFLAVMQASFQLQDDDVIDRPDGWTPPKIICLAEGDEGSFKAELIEFTGFEMPSRVMELMEGAGLHEELATEKLAGRFDGAEQARDHTRLG